MNFSPKGKFLPLFGRLNWRGVWEFDMFFMLFARSTPASSLASACDYGDDGFVDFEADDDKSEDGDDDGVWCEQQCTPRPVGHEGLPLLRDSLLYYYLHVLIVIIITTPLTLSSSSSSCQPPN